MNEGFEDYLIKEKAAPIIIVKEYKKKNNIKDSGYSDKIEFIFNSLGNKLYNIGLRRKKSLLSVSIQEKFKNVYSNCKKSELSFIISYKFNNFKDSTLKVEGKDNSFSKIIMDKFNI